MPTSMLNAIGHANAVVACLRLECGSSVFASGGETTVTFANTFTSAPLVVASSSDRTLNASARAATTSDFVLGCSGVATVTWLAIGADQ